MKSLQRLYLNHDQVTDAGLKELAGLKSLQTLNLGATKVTDAGLKELAGLKNLQELTIWGTPVTDAGLKELAGMKNLQDLDLSGTAVTDAGLKELAGMAEFARAATGQQPARDGGRSRSAEKGFASMQYLSLAGALCDGMPSGNHEVRTRWTAEPS